jgi:hypothetical protein
MIKGYYKIAGVVIELHSIYEYIHDMSYDYRIEKREPDIVIRITKDDLKREEKELAYTGEHYPDELIETYAVHRKLADKMLEYDVLLFHGSAVAVDGQVYLFTAKSGTGKSTHTRLWRQKFGSRAVMVNDDKPMLKVYKDRVEVCGTPWSGKEYINTNVELPLKAICIISQDKVNHIERISVEDALTALWIQSYRPEGVSDMEKMIGLFCSIAEHIPLYRLGCNMTMEAADVAWEGMKNA